MKRGDRPQFVYGHQSCRYPKPQTIPQAKSKYNLQGNLPVPKALGDGSLSLMSFWYLIMPEFLLIFLSLTLLSIGVSSRSSFLVAVHFPFIYFYYTTQKLYTTQKFIYPSLLQLTWHMKLRLRTLYIYTLCVWNWDRWQMFHLIQTFIALNNTLVGFYY